MHLCAGNSSFHTDYTACVCTSTACQRHNEDEYVVRFNYPHRFPISALPLLCPNSLFAVFHKEQGDDDTVTPKVLELREHGRMRGRGFKELHGYICHQVSACSEKHDGLRIHQQFDHQHEKLFVVPFPNIRFLCVLFYFPLIVFVTAIN